MRRRSRLPVLLRLARLHENRTLQTLWKARAVVETTQESLQTLEGKLASTHTGAVLPQGRKLDAAILVANAQYAASLELGSQALKQELEGARAHEEGARVEVVNAKLRLRTLQSAAAKRKAREGLLMRRAEARRMDEAGRGMRPDEET